MNIAKLMAALALTLGAHTGGHVQEADGLRVPGDVHFTGPLASEQWYTSDPDEQARIANAGFEGQSVLGNIAQDTQMEQPVDLANSLYKLAYLSNVGSVLGNNNTQADMNLLKNTFDKTTKHVAQGALLASALSDLWRSQHPDTPWSLGYGQSSTGAPMLNFRVRW
jgi:hypothetical protein